MKQLEKTKSVERVYKLKTSESIPFENFRLVAENEELRRINNSLRNRMRFFSENRAKYLITYFEDNSLHFVTLTEDKFGETKDLVNSIKMLGGREINIFEKKDYYINKCVVCFNETCSCTPRN